MSDSHIPYELSAMEGACNYRTELLRRFDPFLGARVLEVGAGIGFFSEHLVARTATRSLVAVEPDPVCRVELEKKNIELEIHSGTVLSLPDDAPFDSVVSSNVLEHIDDDAAEVQRYFELLRPGGYFCLFVPARRELFAPIDVSFGHFRRYEKKGLRVLLEDAGFEVRTISYFNFIGYFLWWLSFVVLKKDSFNPRMVRVYDQIAFPVVSLSERLLGAPPIGQSLLVIARRSEE